MHISVRRALQTAVLASGVVVAGSGLALASPDAAAPSPAIRCAEGDASACASQEQASWSQTWMEHIPVSAPDCPCEEGSENECENPPTSTVPTLPPTTVPPITSTPGTSTPGTSTPGSTPPATTTAPTGTPDLGTSTPNTPATVTTSTQHHVVHVGGSHRVPPVRAQRTPELANTGVDPVMLLVGGLATVLAGAAAVLFARRKRA